MPTTIAAIVPAAGASRRMGQDKRRLAYRGHTVIEATVATLCEAGLDPVVVVLEKNSPCTGLPGLQRAQLAVNPRPERGMLSSILSAIDALDAASIDAVAIQPGDHPFVPVEAVRALVEHFATTRPLLLAPRFPERRGHPLIIASELFAEMRRCDPEVGLRQLLQRRAADLVELPLPYPDADADLDVPSDLERLKD
jgi:molybdenum cofactor cytidylyltransferase